MKITRRIRSKMTDTREVCWDELRAVGDKRLS